MQEKWGKFGDSAFKHVHIWQPRSQGYCEQNCQGGGCEKGSVEDCRGTSWQLHVTEIREEHVSA